MFIIQINTCGVARVVSAANCVVANEPEWSDVLPSAANLGESSETSRAAPHLHKRLKTTMDQLGSRYRVCSEEGKCSDNDYDDSRWIAGPWRSNDVDNLGSVRWCSPSYGPRHEVMAIYVSILDSRGTEAVLKESWSRQ